MSNNKQIFDIIDSEQDFSKGISPYRLIKGEFDVCQPYFRAKKEESLDSPVTKKQKKNKPKNPSNADLDTQKRHQELRPQLALCLEQLPERWPDEWKAKTTPTIIDPSADDESQAVDFPSIQQMVETAQDKFSFNTPPDKDNDLHAPEFELTLAVTVDVDIFSIFNTVYINKSLTDVKLLQFTPSATYLIPPKSSFLMGSMQNSLDQLGSHINKLGGADLIVMDPPWPNKSVQRSSHYETQDIYDLYSIPMDSMISNKDTIVAIWVTNKPKFRNFIINKLFPSWKLKCISEWVWLKMTTQRECIFPIDSEHKKPYEQLIIGRPVASNDMSLPESHIIVSVPSTRHSRKPPLHDILGAYLNNKKDPVCVEMFSRCLYPGWISWGNECLKFQHLSFFEKEESK
ncbi:hypothetical protein PS15m_006724 [Mucor circinelloides]